MTEIGLANQSQVEKNEKIPERQPFVSDPPDKVFLSRLTNPLEKAPGSEISQPQKQGSPGKSLFCSFIKKSAILSFPFLTPYSLKPDPKHGDQKI